MGGVLSFTITADSSKLIAESNKGGAAIAALIRTSPTAALSTGFSLPTEAARRLSVSANDINRAFDRAAHEGVRNMNLTMTASTKSLTSMSNLMAMVGASVAPQFSMALMGVTTAFQGVKAGAEAAGMGLGVFAARVGVVAAAVAGLAFSLNILGDEYGALLDRIQASEGLEGLQGQIAPVLGSLQQAVTEKKVSPAEYDKMYADLTSIRDPEALYKKLMEARKMARRGEVTAAHEAARQEATLRLSEFAAAAQQDPLERRRQQSTAAARRDILELNQLAERAGISTDELVRAREAVLEQELRDINATTAATPTETRSAGFARPEVSAWEKIGLVLRGGAGSAGGGDRYARATADQTRQTNELLKRTNEILRSRSGESFAHK